MTTINSDKRPAGLYIHIPFCLKKCGYCDFLSFGGCGEELQHQYAEALASEITMQTGQLDTVFIGGGTPSLLSSAYITAILEAAQAAFCLEKQAEISLEANPKTLNSDKLRTYRQAGINRLSIGAQSMDDGLLSFMGRAHNRADFLANFQAARDEGFENINVDLMFGIPGQTREMWHRSLREVIELEPEHISFYSLQLEEGTPFSQMYREGRIDLPPLADDRRMYHEGIGMLRDAGYHHYEISNCAKPGYECRHNLKYWNFDEYYGAGLGAHSFLYDRGRSSNASDFDSYFGRISEGQFPVDTSAYEDETLSELMGEYVFTALRKMEGLNTKDFFRVFGKDFFEVYQEQLRSMLEYEQKGLLTLSGEVVALTEAGIDISNEIMAEFV